MVLHVRADPSLSLREAHDLGGRVRIQIVKEVPSVVDVLVHMEPLED
ncbi:cation transporter dimerization domain-containing protein [Gemmatimonadota bacterium]